ncbi:MAG TPA: dihydrofolate reductase family protein, partial [Puia sp.]|nr:dihydrofolate reductase family protein [Puia sp.]
PDTTTTPAEKELWQGIHSKNKYVFSSQNRQDDNATFISSDIANEVAKIKQQGGKDIWLYGGASLIKTFINAGLIDIYKVSVHPVVLGTGKPLFEDVKDRIGLRLMETNVYKSGVVQLTYEPVK